MNVHYKTTEYISGGTLNKNMNVHFKTTEYLSQ